MLSIDKVSGVLPGEVINWEGVVAFKSQYWPCSNPDHYTVRLYVDDSVVFEDSGWLHDPLDPRDEYSGSFTAPSSEGRHLVCFKTDQDEEDGTGACLPFYVESIPSDVSVIDIYTDPGGVQVYFDGEFIGVADSGDTGYLRYTTSECDMEHTILAVSPDGRSLTKTLYTECGKLHNVSFTFPTGEQGGGTPRYIRNTLIAAFAGGGLALFIRLVQGRLGRGGRRA